MGRIKKVLTSLTWVPFLGALHETTKRDHLEACKELGVSQLLSTMPMWAGIFIVAWPNIDFGPLLQGTKEMSKNGELFIYAATTLAPIIYLVSRERDRPRAFPNKWWYLGAVIFVTVIAALVFVIQRMKPLPLTTSTFWVSALFYAVALILLYLAFVYNNTYLPDPAGAMRDEEDEYTKRLKEHR